MKQKLIRLDKFITDRKLAASRTAAQNYIEEGRVTVGGVTITKAASMVPQDASVKIDAPEREWVSRGAYKLLKAIESFAIKADGRRCVDIGASTGGFTEVLLANGAAKVYAVDVGYGQLAWKLRGDPRVAVLERTNARNLTLEMIDGEKADIVVSDASFISITLLLPKMEELLKEDGLMAVLVKPQFEAGREKVGKKGVVRDPAVHLEVLEHFLEHAKESRFTVLGLTYSPIRGPEGNIEYLGYLSRAEEEPPVHDLKALVEASHAALEEKKGENDA